MIAIRGALIPHRTCNASHQVQAETAVGRLREVGPFRESSRHSGRASAAGVEGYTGIFERHHDTLGADVHRHVNAQFAALRCAMAHDVADDLLEDQLDIVAAADVGLLFLAVERAAQLKEGLFEAPR
jgi:hypothetical protein